MVATAFEAGRGPDGWYPNPDFFYKVGGGPMFDVEIPTHISGVMDFTSGAVGTIITSFDVWSHSLPRIEIYGPEGPMSVPDPNTFRARLKSGVQDRMNGRTSRLRIAQRFVAGSVSRIWRIASGPADPIAQVESWRIICSS